MSDAAKQFYLKYVSELVWTLKVRPSPQLTAFIDRVASDLALMKAGNETVNRQLTELLTVQANKEHGVHRAHELLIRHKARAAEDPVGYVESLPAVVEAVMVLLNDVLTGGTSKKMEQEPDNLRGGRPGRPYHPYR